MAGCLDSFSEDSASIHLNVGFDTAYAMLMTSYDDGQQIGFTEANIRFDFSGTTPIENVQLFGIDSGDGREILVSDNTAEPYVDLQFTKHGLYNVTAFAVDVDGIQTELSIVIRIEHRITWNENNTDLPTSLFIDPTPGNNDLAPSHFVFNSTVHNPSLFDLDGRDVSISWSVKNDEGICQRKLEDIGNGESAEWKTIHFSPVGLHEFEVKIEDGQDRVDVNHVLEILYPEDEAESSP